MSSSTSSSERVIPGQGLRCVVVTVLCFLLLERLWAFVAVEFDPEVSFSIFGQRLAVCRDGSKSYDVLFLGDSSLGAGVVPEVFTEETGLSAYNLSTVGDGMLMADSYLLEEYLRHHRPPKAVVMMHVYDVWHRGIDMRLFNMHFTRPAELWTLLRHRLTGRRRVIDAALQLVAPSYRYKAIPERILCTAARRGPGHLRRERAQRETFFRRQLAAGGFLPQKQDPFAVSADIRYHLDFVSSHDFRVSGANRYYLARMLRTAERGGFRVYFAFAPVAEEFAGEASAQRYLSAAREWVTMGQTGDAGKPELLAEDYPRFPVQMLAQTIDHLSARTAEAFSRTLARLLLRAQAQQTGAGERPRFERVPRSHTTDGTGRMAEAQATASRGTEGR